MKKTRKIISLLLSILMIITSVPLMAVESFAADTVQSGTTGECTWTLDSDGVLTISGNGKMEDYEYDYYGKKAPWGTLITKAIIENGVKNIGTGSFYKCKSLKELYIMGDVSTWFSPNEELDSLTNLFLGKDVTNIQNNLFFGSLENITVAEENESYCSVDGVLFNKDKTELIKYPSSKKDESYTIPDCVISIGDYAFDGCTSLTSVTISDSVIEIGYSAFGSCTSLKELTIPDSVIEIGDGAFSGANMDVLTLGKGIRSIGDYALSNSCKKLVLTGDITTNIYNVYYTVSTKALEIGKDVTRIDSNFFFASLENITVAEENESYSSVDGVLFNKDKTELVKYPSGRETETYAVPDGVKIIGGSAFEGYAIGQESNKYIKSIIFPDSLVEIKESAFSDCTSLTSITIPKNVTSVGGFAFRNCSSLTSITIPDSVTYIGREAFGGCKNLKEVNLGKSVTCIEDSAFVDCIYMNSITIPQDCRVERDAFGFVGGNTMPNFTVYGYTGSDAERYAKENNFNFVSIGTIHTLSSVEIAKLPDKTTYNLGEDFNTTGLELLLTYSDGETKTLLIPKYYWLEGYEIYGYDTSTSGTKTVTVTYGGFTATFEITVIAPSTLAIAKLPNKTTYKIGEEFEVNGLELLLTYADGETRTLTVPKYYWEEGYEIYGYDTSTSGTKNVTVTYGGFTATFEITVLPDSFSYPDVSTGDWFYLAVRFNTEKGYFRGYESGNFGPTNNIQRQDFAVILARIAGADLSAYEGQNGGFADVPTDAYYSSAVAWAKDTGAINGYRNDYFGVGTSITREQICVIFYRYYNGSAPDDISAILTAYPDGKYVSDWAKSEVAWAVKNGIIGGSDFLNAIGNANRAEAAQIIANMSSKGFFNAITEIHVSKLPIKTTYYLGEDIDVTGLELTVTYSNGLVETVSNAFNIKGFDTNKLGNQTIIVNYQGKQVSFEISVLENPVPTTKFTDVTPDDWYYNAVKFCLEKGYFLGESSTYFGASQLMEKQDFVVLLANIAGVDLTKYDGRTGWFTDVPTRQYYSAAIAWAEENNIVKGHNNGKFGVGEMITREEVCVILYNYFKNYLKEDVSITGTPEANLSKYHDGADVTALLRMQVAWAAQKNIVGGNGYLNPKSNVTKAEVAQIIYNMANKGMI